MNRTLVVAAVLLSLGFLPTRVARADFYRCQYDGREWFINKIQDVPKRIRRHCKLIMKTQEAPAADEGADSGDAKERPKKRRAKRLAPHTPRLSGTATLPEERLWSIVLEAAERYTLPPAFVLGVIKVESNFNPRAVSRVGAQGLMQLMPRTAESMGVTDPFNPRQNVMGGCRYLRILANRFDGDLPRVIAGYHAGGSAVAKKEGVPYAQSEQYVRWVLDRYYEYKRLLAD